MAKDAATLLENYKKTITMVRGKKYTFNLNTFEEEGEVHPFYFTTDANVEIKIKYFSASSATFM